MKPRDYSDLAAPGVRDLTPCAPGGPVCELEREYGMRDAIKLASNENPLGASPRAVAAARSTLDRVGLYPDASGFHLKQALADKHGVPVESITLGNGSSEVLALLAQAFLQPGLEAVFSQYGFAVYPVVTRRVGATARAAPALPAGHPVMPLGHDLRGLFERVGGRTRMVFIANPNNPTGTWLGGGRLKDFIGSLPPRVICVVDEAYAEYAESGEPGDASGWLDEFPNLVVTRTFSKAYGLAGLRVGYALSNPGIAELVNRVRPPFSVNAPGLAAARAALDDHAFIAETRRVNSAGRQQLADGFERLGLAVIPSAANFLLVGLDRPGSGLHSALLERGVIVCPVGRYGLKNYLRISVGTPARNDRLLAALAEVLGA